MLLEYSTLPRAMSLFDIYTDVVVAKQLYDARESIFFMFCCLFIAFPFIMVWSASLRFVQRYMDKLENSESRSARMQYIMKNKPNEDVIKDGKSPTSSNKNSKNSGSTSSSNNNTKNKTKFLARWQMDKLSLFENIILSLYIFPFFGIIMVSIYEVYWIITDIIIALKCWFRGQLLIIDEESEYKSFKRYRKILEMVGESGMFLFCFFFAFLFFFCLEETCVVLKLSRKMYFKYTVPQSILSLIMFIFAVPVDPFDLALSLTSSVINLSYNAARFWREARFHGMSWNEYSVAMLQLGEIPIVRCFFC